MIEHLKNIIVGLWCLGLICAILTILMGLGYFLIKSTVLVVLISVLIVAWLIGKFLRT